MDRTQFTFYDSFYHGIKGLKTKGEQAAALFAICEYALYGAEPETLPGSARSVYVMAKPVLNAARRKAEAGKKGGKAGGKQNGSKAEAESKQTEAKGEQEKEQVQVQDKVQDKEQMLYTPPPDGVGVYTPTAPEESGAVAAYMRLISPTPSPASMQELLGFERHMDTECCLRAINAALDANAKNWLYVRQVLRDKQAAGVKTVEDWNRLEAERRDARERKTKGPAMGRTEDSGLGYAVPADPGDLDLLLAELEREDGHAAEMSGR